MPAGTSSRTLDGIPGIAVLDASGNAQPVSPTTPIPVGGATAVLEYVYGLAGITPDVVLPATPTAYQVGGVIGGMVTIPLARVNGGSGLLLTAALIERMNALAWNATAVTVTSASPGVVTLNAHGLQNGNRVKFGGTAVPTGLTAGTTYYVVAKAANTFQVSATLGGAAINTTSTGTAVTVTEVYAGLPAWLWFNRNAWAAAVTDNALFDPTYADMLTAKTIAKFSVWDAPGNGRHGISTTQFQVPFRAAAASLSLYGVLLFEGAANQILSPHAELVLRIGASLD